jgi:kynurenine formamidase
VHQPGFNAETPTLNPHTATNADVPYHFDDYGPSIERMPLTAFAAPAVFLDLRERVKQAS